MELKKERREMANKAIKYRIYPTTEQSIMFAKTFGCCRKVYNLMFTDKIAHYKATGKSIQTTPAQYKDKYPYLREVDSLALANVWMNLQAAFHNTFSKSRKKKNGFPRFKSRKARNSYTTNNQKGTVAIIDDKYIKIPKIGKVKAVIHRKANADWKIKSATISKERDGSYYISVLFKFERVITKITKSRNAIGLDYKSDGLYMDSNGNMGTNHKLRKANKIHRHIANQRLDNLHKMSTEIANQYDVVCVESLNMRSMANRGFGNGKATMDNGYGIFLNMLEYKLSDRGKTFVKVDRFYPSSQICSCCGSRKKLSLSDRKYICTCGLEIDRDLNAAINIKNEGLRLLA